MSDVGQCFICGDYIQNCDCGCLDNTIDEEGYMVQYDKDGTKLLGNAHVFCIRTTKNKRCDQE